VSDTRRWWPPKHTTTVWACFRNSAGLPLLQFFSSAWVACVLNEGGRGFTLSIYRRPFGVRVYLAGRAWAWWSDGFTEH